VTRLENAKNEFPEYVSEPRWRTHVLFPVEIRVCQGALGRLLLGLFISMGINLGVGVRVPGTNREPDASPGIIPEGDKIAQSDLRQLFLRTIVVHLSRFRGWS
jgi:hypothetical protein